MTHQTPTQEVTVTLPWYNYDIVQEAYSKWFTNVGRKINDTTVGFDFQEDANEYKQCLNEEFGINPSKMITKTRLK